MKLIVVESSAVRAVNYDPAKRRLTVMFLNGGLYEYYGVPEKLYKGFMAAQPHPWSKYGKEIKAHRYRKIVKD